MPFADAAGARIYYEIHGTGQPLLLIPGFGCTVEIYSENTPELAVGHRVIVFDPRGCGRSDAPTDGYSMDVYADDCLAVLRAAGEDAAHVLGTSFGGMVALNFAVRNPARVRSLVLGCTTAGGAGQVSPTTESVALFLAAAEIEDPAAATRMRYPLNYSAAYAAAHDAEIVGRAVATAHLRQTAEGRNGQLAAVNGHDVWDRLPAIAAPTLIAHGDGDGLVPVENGRNLASRIPGSTLKIYEGARHVFFIERAREFNADVAGFLDMQDEAVPNGS